MKKINKKTKIGILSVMSVFVFALCLFGITQFNGQEIPGNNDEILFDSATNQANDAQSNNADNSSPVATLDNFESSSVVKEPQNEINNYQNTSGEDSNNADFNITEEQKANVPVRSGKLVEDDFVPVSQGENSLKLKDSSNAHDLAYKLVNDTETGFKQLVIGSYQLPGGTTFNSETVAPWVNENQKYITSVKIDNDRPILPRSTVGWFGCVTELRPGEVFYSNIKKIEGLNLLDMRNVTNATCMFCGSDWIESIDGSDSFLSSIKNIKNATAICMFTSLNNDFMVNLAKKIALSATNTSYAFAKNFNLTSFDLGDDVAMVATDAKYMLYENTNLLTVNAKSLISNKATTVKGMFGNCSALTSINFSIETDWSMITVSSDNLFDGCTSLIGGEGTTYDSSKVDKSMAKTDRKTTWGGEAAGYFKGPDATKVTRPNPQTRSFEYDGSVKSLNISPSTYYTIEGNSRKDAGETPVTVTLEKDVPLVWDDGSTAPLTFTLIVTKATNSIITLTCSNIDIGSTPSPSATAKFGEPTFSYSNSEAGPFGPWDETNPGGLYYVKASVEETNNYTAAEQTKAFTVNKKDPNITVPEVSPMDPNQTISIKPTKDSTALWNDPICSSDDINVEWGENENLVITSTNYGCEANITLSVNESADGMYKEGSKSFKVKVNGKKNPNLVVEDYSCAYQDYGQCYVKVKTDSDSEEVNAYPDSYCVTFSYYDPSRRDLIFSMWSIGESVVTVTISETEKYAGGSTTFKLTITPVIGIIRGHLSMPKDTPEGLLRISASYDTRSTEMQVYYRKENEVVVVIPAETGSFGSLAVEVIDVENNTYRGFRDVYMDTEDKDVGVVMERIANPYFNLTHRNICECSFKKLNRFNSGLYNVKNLRKSNNLFLTS